MLIVAKRPKVLKGLLHQVQHSQAVDQAIVVRPRISQVADSQLMDAAQALNFRRIEEVKEPLVSISTDGDVVVQRVPKNLGRHGSPMAMTRHRSLDELVSQFLDICEKRFTGWIKALKLKRMLD